MNFTLRAKRLFKPAWDITTSPVRSLNRIIQLQQVEIAFAKASIALTARQIDPQLPSTWEFSAFSQNGEDGIIDYLASHLKNPNAYFVEFGASDGLQNNTSWLAIAKGYSGLMVDGDSQSIKRALALYNTLRIARVRFLHQFITHASLPSLLERFVHRNPDVFSLDIDGNDYYIAHQLLETGLRPKIWVVEYNSAFGPDRPITIPYDERFFYLNAHASGLYFGVSIAGWRALFRHYGYQFVTIDLNGVNAFFIHPDELRATLDLTKMDTITFRENSTQLALHGSGWEGQYALIQHLPVIDIGD